MEGNRLVKEVVFGEMGGKTKRRSRREWVDDYKGMVQRGDNYMYRLRTKRKDAIKAHGKNSSQCVAIDTNGTLDAWMDGILEFTLYVVIFANLVDLQLKGQNIL